MEIILVCVRKGVKGKLSQQGLSALINTKWLVTHFLADQTAEDFYFQAQWFRCLEERYAIMLLMQPT